MNYNVTVLPGRMGLEPEICEGNKPRMVLDQVGNRCSPYPLSNTVDSDREGCSIDAYRVVPPLGTEEALETAGEKEKSECMCSWGAVGRRRGKLHGG